LVDERDRLRAEIEVLKLRLEALGHGDLTDVSALIELRLNRQEATLYELLLAASPRAIGRYAIEAALPRREHTTDRQSQLVDVLISKLRRKLGSDAIETVPGVGWRINPIWKAEGPTT
jgi:DNA-binding response OmpR family regulator